MNTKLTEVRKYFSPQTLTLYTQVKFLHNSFSKSVTVPENYGGGGERNSSKNFF